MKTPVFAVVLEEGVIGRILVEGWPNDLPLPAFVCMDTETADADECDPGQVFVAGSDPRNAFRAIGYIQMPLLPGDDNAPPFSVSAAYDFFDLAESRRVLQATKKQLFATPQANT